MTTVCCCTGSSTYRSILCARFFFDSPSSSSVVRSSSLHPCPCPAHGPRCFSRSFLCSCTGSADDQPALLLVRFPCLSIPWHFRTAHRVLCARPSTTFSIFVFSLCLLVANCASKHGPHFPSLGSKCVCSFVCLYMLSISLD